MHAITPHTRPWTVNQAKTHLSAILRKAKEGEPQIIGTREQFVLVPLEKFQQSQEMPIGSWLAQEGPKVGLDDDLPLPSRTHDRPIVLGEA